MEKGRCVRVIEREEVRRDDPVEYFLPIGVGSTSWFPEGVMAVEVHQNEETYGEERMEEEKESVLPVDAASSLEGAGNVYLRKPKSATRSP